MFRFGLRLADALTTQAPQPAEEEVVIPAEAALELAGAVEGMVEGFLVVAADPARQTLDIDSALCFDDRTPLGRVHEVFGPVKKPYYAVLNAHVERLRAQGREALLTRGTPVYYVPQASCFVQPTIIYTRGSDASGEHDEEPPEDVRAPLTVACVACGGQADGD